jgi:hypothetical protein
LAHIIQCDVCTNRWPDIAEAATIGIMANSIGPRMADGSFIWSDEHDYENCPECAAIGAWLGY